MVWHLDDSDICVISGLGAKRERVVEGGSFTEIVFNIKFGIIRASMDGIGFGFGNVLYKVRVEVIKVYLGILHLLDWRLVDGVGGELGEPGGHL